MRKEFRFEERRQTMRFKVAVVELIDTLTGIDAAQRNISLNPTETCLLDGGSESG